MFDQIRSPMKESLRGLVKSLKGSSPLYRAVTKSLRVGVDTVAWIGVGNARENCSTSISKPSGLCASAAFPVNLSKSHHLDCLIDVSLWMLRESRPCREAANKRKARTDLMA